jgi:hypothetical protein
VEEQHVARPFSLFWLVFTFLAGAAAWSAFHLLAYLWVTVACSVPERILTGGTAAVASGITVAGMAYQARAWRGLRERGAASEAQRATLTSDRFVALCGLYLNAFFLASILLTVLSIFFLSACE